MTDSELDRRARRVAAAGTLAEVEELLTHCAARGLALRAEMLRLDRRRAELAPEPSSEPQADELARVTARLELLRERWTSLSSSMSQLRGRRDTLSAA